MAPRPSPLEGSAPRIRGPTKAQLRPNTGAIFESWLAVRAEIVAQQWPAVGPYRAALFFAFASDSVRYRSSRCLPPQVAHSNQLSTRFPRSSFGSHFISRHSLHWWQYAFGLLFIEIFLFVDKSFLSLFYSGNDFVVINSSRDSFKKRKE